MLENQLTLPSYIRRQYLFVDFHWSQYSLYYVTAGDPISILSVTFNLQLLFIVYNVCILHTIGGQKVHIWSKKKVVGI